MDIRTTLVDRRLAAMVFEGIPADVSEEAIKRHLGNKALFHKAEGALLRADLTSVDLEAIFRLLSSEPQRLEIRQFALGVLDSVRALGGQFAEARMTSVSGSETLEFQRNNKVIKFRTDWHFQPGEQTRLHVKLSLASQVIYLPDILEYSLKCSFNKVEDGRLSVQEILDSLPKVEGLRWIVGNIPTINCVMTNHLKETNEYILHIVYTWTTDEYNHPRYGLNRLVVGLYDSDGVFVRCLGPGGWLSYVGLFILGVPE